MERDAMNDLKRAQEQCNQATPVDPRIVGYAANRSQGIGWAIKQMYHGLKVRRQGWNGRGMYLAIQFPDANSANTLPYVWIKTVQGDRVPWLCSQTDLLAQDWEVATVPE